MFAKTNTDHSPWTVVRSDGKKRARLNCIRHLLSPVPYEDLQREKVQLPERAKEAGYVRPPFDDQTLVPDWYADVGGEVKK